MPSPDDTFFRIRRLHAAFAVSSAALLAATAWMIGADHWRGWRAHQRAYRERVEPWLAAARIAQAETDGHLARAAELAEAVARAEAAVPDRALVERFARALERDAAARGAGAPDVSGVTAAHEALAAQPGAGARAALLARLRRLVDAAEARRANIERTLRLCRGDLDEARSAYEMAVGRGRARAELDVLQARVDRVQEQIAALSSESEEAAEHAAALAGVLTEITRPEDEARRALAAHEAEGARVRRGLAGRGPSVARRVLEQPLIDALGRTLAVEQIWLPDLTIDYHFARVARTDRCVTCHQGIARSEAGAPGRPAVPREQVLSLQMPRPAEAPRGRGGEGGAGGSGPEEALGFALAPRGMLDDDAPTVWTVAPRTPAAEADLRPGDVVLKIDGRPVSSAGEVEEALFAGLDAKPQAGGAFLLEVRRGLSHPYCSHPRMDLFAGPRSPHPAETFGCTVCHEGQGSATEFKWASHSPDSPAQAADWKKRHGWFRNEHWDHPMLPARFAESRCLTCHHAVTDLAPSGRFPDPPAPKLLAGYHLVRQYGCFGCHEIKGVDGAGRAVGPDMRLEPDGALRKVGPSLRDLGMRTGAAYVADRIADPAHYLPASRMPRLFGLHEYLEKKALDDAKRFEAVEVLAAAHYLLAASEGGEPLPAPAEVTEPPSPQRGKRLFLHHGCLACHAHRDFPAGQGTQGPDLSRAGAKYTESGARWLAGWLRDPAHYSPRTLMPNPLLVPETLGGDGIQEEPRGEAGKRRMTDPAADIAAYLLAGKDFRPAATPEIAESDLDELALLYLGRSYPRALASQYVREGIPASEAGRMQGEAAELLAPLTRDKKLRYVGRRTIARRGCFGCHDIAGMEGAQPIGPALSDWGRKQESLLAFEQVHRFLEVEKGDGADLCEAPGGPLRGESGPSPSSGAAGDPDWDFYADAVRGKRREGFAWQKLRGPRAFDYEKAHNKPYTEWLLMGRFNFTPQEREQIVTFVLGLVADPPGGKYVYQPDARRGAVVRGQQVLDKYACAECHTLEMERWTVKYRPGGLAPPPAQEDYDFLAPRFTPEELAASRTPDRRGRLRAEVAGMPRLDAAGEAVRVEGDEEDAEGEPLPMRAFVLWEPAAIEGRACVPGGADLLVYEHQIAARRAPVGGAFARLLYPALLAEAKGAALAVAGMEPWGWGPPPLAGEGRKVRPDWLYRYLLDPTIIRPASVLRMPRYNFSPEEAAALTDYFAAVDGAEFPYAADERTGAAAAGQGGAAARLDEAFRILIDRKTFCAKCHVLGDYSPGGEVRTTLGPDLEQAGARLRADYLLRWLANPQAVLPYTGMPVNFPPRGEPLGQDLFPGTSREQLEAVSELLLRYDEYLRRRHPVRALIEGAEKPE